jgi:hypothetical protein
MIFLTFNFCKKWGDKMIGTKSFLILLGIFFIIVFSPDFSGAADNTEEYDFGYVEVGSIQTALVSVSNLSGDIVELSGFSFTPDSCSFFSINTSFSESISILPFESANIEIGYAPQVVGECSATLYIFAGFPMPSSIITLTGIGVEQKPEQPNPEEISQVLLEKLQKIIDYIDETNAIGTDRAFRSYETDKLSERRLKAYKKMLIISYYLIENEHFEAARNKLKEVYKKTDGKPESNDFVSSEKVPRLPLMLRDLIASFDFEDKKAKKTSKVYSARKPKPL